MCMYSATTTETLVLDLSNGQLQKYTKLFVFVEPFCIRHSNNWKQTLEMKQNLNTARSIICEATAPVIKQSMNIWSSLVHGSPFNLTGKHHCSAFVIYREHHFKKKKRYCKITLLAFFNFNNVLWNCLQFSWRCSNKTRSKPGICCLVIIRHGHDQHF